MKTINLKYIYVILAFVFALTGKIVCADGPWFTDMKEHILRAQSANAIAKFCEKYSSSPAVKTFVTSNKIEDFDEMQNNYTHDWIKVSLDFVESILKENPPTIENNPIRSDTFRLLDYVFYADNKAVNRGGRKMAQVWEKETSQIYKTKPAKILKEMSENTPESGIIFWKLYNCGFVFKSKETCIAIDLRPGFGCKFSAEEIKSFAEKLNVLLITHAHGDHYDVPLIEGMLKAGKLVLAPQPEGISKELANKYENFVKFFGNNQEIILTWEGVNITAYDGSQGVKKDGSKIMPNNVYYIEMGGVNFMANGDNSINSIYSKIGDEKEVDISFATIWADWIKNISLSKPKHVVTQHENELHHEVHGRVAHRWIHSQLKQMKDEKLDIPQSVISLSSGEMLHFPAPDRNKNKAEKAAKTAKNSE